jgi:hypothetical protein
MAAPEISTQHRNVARQMRAKARRGWYVGDMASLQAFGTRSVLRAATEPELTTSLLFSRDKMHHSVGWWRNAEYEYCWHLSISTSETPDGATKVKVPQSELRYWTHAFYPEDFDKVWLEPGGTDPRLTQEEKLRHATMFHMRVFLEPQLLDSRGEPFHPFIPKGEVYDFTRWIDGVTPDKVDR